MAEANTLVVGAVLLVAGLLAGDLYAEIFLVAVGVLLIATGMVRTARKRRGVPPSSAKSRFYTGNGN